MPRPRLPVIVLTGFLGAGKTTLLNALLRAPEMARTAVLVNEFGAIGIDQALIVQACGGVVLLENGCVCCTVREGLAGALVDLAKRRERRETLPFERVVIETTGAADPFPIVEMLAGDAAVAARYDLRAVLTVVDALNAESTWAARPEAAAQLAAADGVWISKASLAASDAHEPLREAVQARNPAATVLMDNDDGALGRLVRACVVGPGVAKAMSAPRRPSHLADGGVGQERLARGVHGWTCICCPRLGGRSRAGAPHELRSVCIERGVPFGWPALGAWLESIVQMYGDALLRAKGIVWIDTGAGRPLRPWVVHGVKGRLAAPVPWMEPDACPGDPAISRMVFIGPGLDADEIGQALRDIEAPASP